MIGIYRSTYDSDINFFHGRDEIDREEVVLKTRTVCGESYTYVEPAKPGFWAFGGTFVYTPNGIYPEFNEALKLHDRDMTKESCKGDKDERDEYSYAGPCDFLPAGGHALEGIRGPGR